ncbi:hypothetical protein CLORAM_01759 [Thomasclavelia ramosa DSM 1402]|jgi:uncharacterized protein|uniref:DUF378 domain-containing protein n=2 Tax=Thomasclavelia ramosa TaxID=1547 RepID=B0N548_9FIRM|nr:hypothetical protein CLORAM_01759 [Thomasclavelia ramosa DSM 1402]
MYKDISNGYTLIRRMKIMNILQKISLVLTIIGAINWGLIGLFNFNLVDSLFGVDSFLSMLIYILVGIAGIINIMLLFTDLDTK